MSTPSHRSRSRSRTRASGLPTWSGISILLAALITGLLLSLNAQAIGGPFLVCFAVAAIVVTLFTDVRGLFLTVASIPVLFGFMTVLTAWTVTRSQAAEGTAPFSTTTIVTALFPLAQFFPVLAAVSLGALAIALFRVWLSGRSRRAAETAAINHRRRAAEADRRNRDTATRARRRTNQVTVEELLARNRSRQTERGARPRAEAPRPEVRPRPQPQPRRGEPPRRREAPRRRRFDDDLYS
ncbi:MAG: amino acid permease [Corynebacterium sp.]|uniref:DUF6542 domain-containing protein n=1 Tax=Corynebacterium sp. TaxID=1720 RepID=UPI0026DECBCF|nr:DUF6542 domain-containing protein [Corynebacterium sp.]MDO5668578.1 amino acid permease [Corynebacterium sp.]